MEVVCIWFRYNPCCLGYYSYYLGAEWGTTMSRRKDRERAKTSVFRNGRLVPRYLIDQAERDKRQAQTDAELVRLGLIPGRTKIIMPKIKPKEQ